MFGKLMKYELRYLIRIFAPMWAAVVALCVMTRITIGPKLTANNLYIEGEEAVLPAILGVITVFAIMTMMIVATVVLIQRFYKGMYGDEGYLMFTLPVTTGQLIHSKALSALIMMIGTETVTLLGVLIMMAYKELWNGDALGMTFPEMWGYFLEMMESNGITSGMLGLYVFWGFVASLIVFVAEIYMVYLAISVGQMWKKHPVAGGIIAFYAINIVISVIDSFIGYNVNFEMVNNVVYREALIAMLLYVTVHGAIVLLVSFFGTKLLLDKKLNIA